MRHGAKHKSTAEQTDNHAHERDCDRCGRARPTNPERFTVTASDFTDATADFERALLCVECWRQYRDDLRRTVA